MVISYRDKLIIGAKDVVDIIQEKYRAAVAARTALWVKPYAE